MLLEKRILLWCFHHVPLDLLAWSALEIKVDDLCMYAITQNRNTSKVINFKLSCMERELCKLWIIPNIYLPLIKAGLRCRLYAGCKQLLDYGSSLEYSPRASHSKHGGAQTRRSRRGQAVIAYQIQTGRYPVGEMERKSTGRQTDPAGHQYSLNTVQRQGTITSAQRLLELTFPLLFSPLIFLCFIFPP